MTQPIPMVHIRKFTLHTLTGHSVGFKGHNEPVLVPAEAVQEAMKAGAAPASEVDLPDNAGITESREERAAAEPTGEERRTLIKQAMRDLVGINSPDDFDANGTPRAAAVNDQLDGRFKVQTAERKALWTELKPELAGS